MLRWFGRLNWSRRVGSVFGAVYVLIGVVGFAVTSGIAFAALRGNDLILFELNPLHNVVHLGIGAALLYAALSSAAASRLMNRLIGGTYLAVAIIGVFIVEADTSLFRGLSEQRSEFNILALNHPDNLLHIASALVLIASTFIGRRRSTDTITGPVAGESPESTGAMPAVEEEELPEEPPRLAAAAPVRRNHLGGGDVVPRSGSYRCACGRFAVSVRAGHEFPDCPEPSGTDDDHYYTLQVKPSASAKRTTTSRSTATAKKASPRRTKTATRR